MVRVSAKEGGEKEGGRTPISPRATRAVPRKMAGEKEVARGRQRWNLDGAVGGGGLANETFSGQVEKLTAPSGFGSSCGNVEVEEEEVPQSATRTTSPTRSLPSVMRIA